MLIDAMNIITMINIHRTNRLKRLNLKFK